MRKTILITGASSGIGKATALYFSKQGWNVAATMRQPQTEKELTQLPETLVTRLDVTDKQSITRAITQTIDRFGRIDVVVNNAGYGAYGILEAASDETINRQYNVNVIGLLSVTRAVLPHFRQNKSGMLINISSIGGKRTFPLATLYHGTKFAVEGISEALSFELEAIGCQVKVVEPGFIDTDFSSRSIDMFLGEDLPEYQPFVQKVMAWFKRGFTNPSSPLLVAKVIHQAATDSSSQLRYTAGPDAIEHVEARRTLTDDQMRQRTLAALEQ